MAVMTRSHSKTQAEAVMTRSQSQPQTEVTNSRTGSKRMLEKMEKSGSTGGIISPQNSVSPNRRNSKNGFSMKDPLAVMANPNPAIPFSTSLGGQRRHSAHTISYADLKTISREIAKANQQTPKAVHAVPNGSAVAVPNGSAISVPCGSPLNVIKGKKDNSETKWSLIKEQFLMQSSLGGRRGSTGSIRLPPLPPTTGNVSKPAVPLFAPIKSKAEDKGSPPGSRSMVRRSSSSLGKEKSAHSTVETESTMDSGNSGADSQGDSDKDSLPDVSFTIENAPTMKEAEQRFTSGVQSDKEILRVHRAFRRFCGHEEDLEKDNLDMVLSHLGYLLVSEEDMEELGNEVSDLSSFDYEELLSFIQGCGHRQPEILQHAFNKRAAVEDSTDDTISWDGLAAVMKEMHLVALRSNLDELLLRASLSDKTHFTYQDVMRVFAAYRTCEGFTVEKLKEAQDKFEEATEETPKDQPRSFPVSELPNALLDLFGVHCVKQLRELVEAAGEALGYCGPHTSPVTFHEYLVWARHLQNAWLLELNEHFENADGDEDGALTWDEVMIVMKHQGFTLSIEEAREFRETAGLEDGVGVTYSFDEVHDMLEIVREAEGFGSQDLQELKDTYARFDTEDEGELTTLQVLDLLRFLGYQVKIEDVERYAKEVDFNGNGTMDIDEYLRLMRLHREEEIAQMQKVFYTFVGATHGRLKFGSLHAALKACKCCSSHCDVFNELVEGFIGEDVSSFSFDEFKGIADQGRKAVKRAQRKKANFSDTEFLVLQQSFVEFDTTGRGFLDQGRLLLLLHKCGLPVHSEEHRWGIDMLDKARQAALDAELSPEDVGKMGANTITFWTMIHAYRMITRENEHKRITRQEEARVACGFSVAEKEEFEKIFTEKQKQYTDEANKVDDDGSLQDVETAGKDVSQGRRRSMPDLYSSGVTNMQETTKEMLTTAKDAEHAKGPSLKIVLGTEEVLLNYTDFKKVLGLLKVKLGPGHVHALQQNMERLTGDAEGSLDFPNFLRMMRWMLDTNFAHLNDLAATAAKLAPIEKPSIEPDFPPSDFSPQVTPESTKGAKLLGRRMSI